MVRLPNATSAHKANPIAMASNMTKNTSAPLSPNRSQMMYGNHFAAKKDLSGMVISSTATRTNPKAAARLMDDRVEE